MSMDLLTAHAIRKIFHSRGGEQIEAVGHVDLNVEQSEFISLIGPSGCGKTTLLHIFAGLRKPTDGILKVKGETRPISSRELGMVLQKPVLFPWLSIKDNILFPAKMLGVLTEETRVRADYLLDLVGLSECHALYPRELSGGMQQRASIARALIHDPEILFMDEPFGALDAITRESLNLELHRIQRSAKKAVVFVTHSIQEAVFLSDRVVVMSARPSRISEIVDIPLGDNRDRELLDSRELGVLVRKIHRSLDG